GGKWKLFIKLHPHLMAAFNQIKDMENVVNVSTYEDIQELLAASDILITDYSSLMFDFAITRRPCFLYVPDLTSYIKNDRDLYFDIPSLPFVHAASNEELIDKIESFNKKIYEKRLSEFLKQIGSYEKGAATEQLVNRMEKICFGEKERLFHEAV
ncbi:MAG: CDP-glycerol glycerophosphotransferase family protein, partial [Heyndrickxia sp.]